MSEDKQYSNSRVWLSKRAWKQAEQRALGQARRVPWTRLAEASDHYTEWHVFSLWLRAVVDAAHTVPEIVKSELKSRMPHLLEASQRNSAADVQQTTSPGTRLWQQVSRWTDENVFASAKAENWLAAVHFFSCISIRSMKAWAHWERTDEIWRTTPPAVFPAYDGWRAEVESVNNLANPGSVCQQVLDAMNQITAQAFTELQSDFFELTAFSLWMELVIEGKGTNLPLLEREILARYRGFNSVDNFSDPQANVRALSEWVLTYRLIEARKQPTGTALSYQIKNHPRYHALRRYAQHCHQVWQEAPPRSIPSFEVWTQLADQYVDFE